ncbi:MAG: UDP-N-acetylmuramoyl-tripeptide--D-alanyl-D-alanine ligase [Firmicutes bacterium]|jgi:UDP-N-acetylmuramoyl-tripeptide--D-alanyl-D-alanine ligase|nr:UDP-N-acetylmuramoyl-tripeptide--D-alanyl-D-alanine ligase [Bacillota bacterium]
MKTFTIGEIVKATNGQLICGTDDYKVMRFSIDSRDIEDGDIFWPTIGARNDAHDFIKQVIDKGCKSFVVSDLEKVPQGSREGLNIILVEDTVKALQALSAYYIKTLPLKKKIGVTGSVGKTSTRDMIYYVASAKYKTGRNKKNYNSGIGLPLSILELDTDTEVAVLEMAMDTYGEIRLLADIVRPDIAVITHITSVNLLSMGNLENILKAKMEITSFFDKDSTLVVNSSCSMLKPEKVAGEYKLITVDTEKDSDYQVSDICDFGDRGIKYTLSRKDKQYEVNLPTAGGHNAINASLAIAVGELLGVDPKEAIEGLKNAQLTGKRLNIRRNNNIKVIDDTYNACEDSIKSAINTLISTDGKRKVAILGDIIGLAHKSEEGHRLVGRYAAEKSVDLLIAIGDDARYYAEGAAEIMNKDKVMYFSHKKDFIQVKDKLIKSGDVVLVKASRGMELEEIVEEILKDKK